MVARADWPQEAKDAIERIGAAIAAELAILSSTGIVPQEANLGCATTRELLLEIAARMEEREGSAVGRALARQCRTVIRELNPSMLDYRTIDS